MGGGKTDTENFDKLSDEKRLAVINAGFICFGRDGFKKTAVSEIAREAGVSKASIFHYFGTKKELYVFLFNFACNAILEDMTEGTEDFFESLFIGMRIKLRVMAKHPGLYDYLLSFMKEDDNALLAELTAVNMKNLQRGQAMLFAKVDWSRFKPEYDKTVIANMHRWVSEGCIRQYADTKSGEEIAAEEEKYLNILKKALYKEEYL